MVTNLGRVEEVSLPSMVRTTVKLSFVTPGWLAVSELSVKSKDQVTVATFFPGSLLNSMEPVGQVSVGGSISGK